MKTWLTARGVPEEHVILEMASRNTLENLVNARGIMAARGWRRACVVTSDYHLRRAMWIARELGIEAQGMSSRAPGGLRKRAKQYLREFASWARYLAGRLTRSRRNICSKRSSRPCK